MKREPTKEELGILVSIESAQTEGYEIVATRKVEKDVYELVLARPGSAKKKGTGHKRPAPTVQGLTATTELADSVLIREGDQVTATTVTPSASETSAISSNWVVRAPRGVTREESVSQGGNSSSLAADLADEVIDERVRSISPITNSVVVDAAGTTAPVAPPATPPGSPEPATTTARAVADANSGPANNPDAFSFDDDESPTATPSSLFDEESSVALPAPGTIARPSSPPPADPTIRVAPRIVTPAPERPKPPAPPPRLAAPTPVVARESEIDESASTAKRRPFSRAKPEVPERRPNAASAPIKPDDKSGGRRMPFSRAKSTDSSSRSNPPAAPIRPATHTGRPHVEIDVRTGRPVENAGAIDARSRTSEDHSGAPLVDVSKVQAKRGRGSKGDGDSGPAREIRTPSEFENHLVERGIVTNEQLDEAFDRHVKTSRHTFECLENLGYTTEDAIAEEVAAYYQLPQCDLPHEELEPTALDLVPEPVARAHTVFPVWISPEGLFVAVAEPSERLAGLLMQASGQTVTMAIAKASDIRWAIENNYHALADVADLVLEFEMGDGQRRRATTAPSPADQAADSAPIVQVVNRILSQAMRDGASDVHIEPADDIVRVRNRVDGVLKVVLVLPAAMGLGLVSRIKIMAEMNIVERRRPQDGKFTSVIDGREIDVRVATVATIWGETCVLRILDKSRSVLGIDDLGMTVGTHTTYSKLIRSPFGMVLCVGPTGSGKTTTLYASLTEISDVARNVMTIEDPVEYVFPSINQIQTNEQAGLTFATGLKSILRQDSDIVLVGEIRDVETARIAVQSTLTGHFVLSSLHATDAISALTRFIDMGIESFLIASSVIAIVGQRLVRRTCTACKEPYEPTDEEMAFYIKGGGPPKDVFYHGSGCNFCGHTGFKDRVGVYELFAMTQEMKRLIVGFATEDEIRDLARKQGMRSIQDEAISLVAADLTTSAEVVRSIYSI